MSELQRKLKQDQKYLRYRSIFKTINETLDLDKNLKEAGYLHRNRKSRALYELRVSPIKLQNASLNDLSNRSRLTEIKALILLQQELLTTAIKETKKHVRTTYADILSSYGTTKESQLLVVESIFSAGSTVLSRIDGAIAMIDLYIKDIDQAGFNLRLTADTLKMQLGGSREQSV
jgi:hypothetical protein